MSDLISNVLDLMRFEAGEVHLQRDWQTVDDLVGAALARLEGRFGDRPVEVALPAELPPVHVDAPLVTQVIGQSPRERHQAHAHRDPDPHFSRTRGGRLASLRR